MLKVVGKYSGLVTMLTPTAARALWLALVENAARIVVDADALYPSPRAQSLIVLAQEEVGKAAWVYKALWNAWKEGDERQLEVSELRKGAVSHPANFWKLPTARPYW